MNYKDIILFSDIDGTLFNRQSTTPQSNIDAIDSFIKEGGSFAIATGRSVNSVKFYAHNVPVNAPCVCFNGSAVYDYTKNEFVHENSLNKEYAAKIIEKVYDKTDAGILIFTKERLCSVRTNQNVLELFELEKNINIEGTPDDVPENWLKVLFTLEPDEVWKIEEVLKEEKERDKKDYLYMYSSNEYYELMPSIANKGNGMKYIASLPQYKGKTVAAIGDYDNDYEMLKAADISACPESGMEKIKKMCDVVTADNDKGAVADFIEKLKYM